MGRTAVGQPLPKKLDAKVEAVEAKADTVMKVKPEMVRITLVTASSRCPRCSMAMKKRNHVLSDKKLCTIIHKLTLSILPSRRNLNFGNRSRA